nr:hypothetical protein [Eubacterium sp.]
MEDNNNFNSDFNSGFNTNSNPNYSMNSNWGQPAPQMPMEPENKKQGLGIAAMILGGLSILCCSCAGLNAIPAIIGLIFSIICVVKGTGRGKTFGIIGIILNGIGLLMAAYMLMSIFMMFDWSAFTPEALSQINEIDPNDEEAVMNWMRQFVREEYQQFLQ